MFEFLKKKKTQQPAEEQETVLQPEEVLDLNDIMQEFAPGEEETAPEGETLAEEAPVEAVSAEEESPVEEEISAQEALSEEAPAAVTEDTVVMDLSEVQEETVENAMEDTVRLDLPESDDRALREGDTVRIESAEQAEPVTEETVRLEIPQEETNETAVEMGDTMRFEPVHTEDKAEPFSQGWEPEYEQPIGEYVPPQPIVFQPKSRLRELKRKLVAGPERRYYELSEQGLLRLQIGIFISLLVAILSTGTTVFYAVGILTQRLKLVAFLQLFGMLVAALMGVYQLMDGVTDIFDKRFSLNSLLAFSFLACIADGVFCLQEQRIPCCAAFTIQMTMSLWSAYHQRSVELGQMDTLRKATRLDGVAEVPCYYDDCAGFLRKEGQVEDFMDHYREPSAMEKITSVYAVLACLVSIASGVVGGVLQGSVSFGLQVLAASLLVAVPGTFFVTLSRPMAILEKRLHKLGTVLCGWPAIAKLCQRAVFPLKHADLFPTGTCNLNGVKFYGSRDPDQVVAYATAVVTAAEGGLAPLFEQLLQSRNGQHYSVENLRLYGNGGIGGEVCGEPVLVGMQEFLKETGVEIPEGTMVAQAVYVAIDGELCGLFAVSCAKSKTVSNGLATLCGYRGLRPVLVTGDFVLTEEYIRSRFGVNTRRMAFPEFAVRKQLSTVAPEQDAPCLALSTREGLSSFAFAVTGARSVRAASIIGMTIHLIGGILGLGIVAVLAVLAAKGLMTPVNMLLFQLIWMLPGLLVTEWTRAV